MTGIKGRRPGADTYAPSADAVGSLYYKASSGLLVPLAPGTSGDVVTSNGSGAAPSYQTPTSGGGGSGGGGALVLLEQHAASSSATLDFTSSITADYDDYVIEFIDIVPATDGVNLLMRMSTNGGSSYDSGNNYLWALTYGVAAGVGGAGNDTTGVSAISVGTITNTANFTFCGSMRLFGPGNSTYKTVTGHFRHRFSSGDARRIGTTLHGSYEVTTAVNAFRFLMSIGNIASGTIRVYGVAKTAGTGGTGGGLVFLERHVASSSANLDFTAFISGTYDKYLIVGEGIVNQTNATDLRITVGTGGGPTYDTANNYEWSHMRFATNGASGVGAGTTGPAKLLTTMRNSAGDSGSFSMTVTGLGSTAQRKQFIGTAAYIDNTGPLAIMQSFGLHWITVGTAATALRFNMSSGNIVSGTITIYGYPNS